jgi:hypothetical protein
MDSAKSLSTPVPKTQPLRLLYLPWEYLTAEEQETALREARRRGALGARSDQARSVMNREPPVPRARPVLYVDDLLLQTPRAWHRPWQQRATAELCAELRVCHFGDAWERTRRALRGEPALPRDAPTLGVRLTEARERWETAKREYRDRSAALCRTDPLRHGHPDRLAMGIAWMEQVRAQEEYWLTLMLARAAGWEACPTHGASGGR